MVIQLQTGDLIIVVSGSKSNFMNMNTKNYSLLFLLLILQLSSKTQTSDGDKPVANFVTSYTQTFSGTWNNSLFTGQWDLLDGTPYSQSDIALGYLQFQWLPKRVLYSKTTYSTPYIFENEIDYANNTNRAGIVIRAYASTPLIAERIEEPNSDPGFNREGIAFYSNKDGSLMNVQFTAVEAGYQKTPQTTITVPRPYGVNSFLERGILRIEDFGATIYVYYNNLPLAKIALSPASLSGGVYTAGTVYNPDLSVAGTFKDMEVLAAGKIAVAQRDATFRLYSSKISITTSGSQPVHYKVFILSGQSNGVGVAANTAFPVEYQAEQTNVQIWAGLQVDPSITNQWLNVKTGFGALMAASGSELSFAKEIAKRFPNDHIRIIKGAWSATSMVEHWLSPSAGIPAKQDFYHLLINTVINPALANITANGDTYELAGFLWMQGESDAIVQSMANDYESNLSYFIKDIRRDLNAENLPFIIAKIDSTSSWPYNSIVRKAEDNVAAKIKHVGIFDTKGFETDGTHYYAPGYVKMGIQFANQIINVLPKVFVSQIWDDAILNDLRLIEILKKYNAKATFAVDAGNLTNVRQPEAWVVNGTAFGKVSIEDIKSTFSEFEIANHGLTHKALPQLSDSALQHEIVESKKLLETWLNRPVKGFVYPGCPFDEISKNAVEQAGHTWGRTCENTSDFCSNTDPFEMRSTVPYNAPNFWDEFNRIKQKGGAFTFWGHTFFTTEAEWVDIEDKIARLSHDPAVVWTNTSDLFDQFREFCPPVSNDSVILGNGDGLTRSLWQAGTAGRPWFRDSICAAVVPQVKEIWGTTSPGCGITNDFWNARYTGDIEALYSENYTFSLTSTQRVHLWIDGFLVIDQWNAFVGQQTFSTSVNLTAGKRLSIKLDYAKMQGNAVLKLEWTSASQPKEVVPKSQLYSSLITSVPTFGANYFSIYPNPATNLITIDSGKQQVDGIYLFNVFGKVVYADNQNFTGSKTLSLSLGKGIYMIRLTGNKPFATQKIIIE